MAEVKIHSTYLILMIPLFRLLSIYHEQIDYPSALAYVIGTGVIGMSLFNILVVSIRNPIGDCGSRIRRKWKLWVSFTVPNFHHQEKVDGPIPSSASYSKKISSYLIMIIIKFLLTNAVYEK